METIEKASDHKQPWLKIYDELGIQPIPEDKRTLGHPISITLKSLTLVPDGPVIRSALDCLNAR